MVEQLMKTTKIIASAGTGKSSALISRIKTLFANKEISNGNRVLVLMFSVPTKNDFLKRLRE